MMDNGAELVMAVRGGLLRGSPLCLGHHSALKLYILNIVPGNHSTSNLYSFSEVRSRYLSRLRLLFQIFCLRFGLQ